MLIVSLLAAPSTVNEWDVPVALPQDFSFPDEVMQLMEASPYVSGIVTAMVTFPELTASIVSS